MSESNGRKNEKEEIKLLIAKVYDKYKQAIRNNKITYTDFLTAAEIENVKKFLIQERINEYVIYGVKNEADRNCICFYPDKFDVNIVESNYSNIFKIIRIKFPKEISFEHREILSGIMKLGIKREKFGDIVIYDGGADIVILNEVSKILLDGLTELTRFRKSKIDLIEISEIIQKENEFEDVSIIISSNRLDNFVSELAKCSRTKANEIIESGRVFINNINEFKYSKKLQIGDVINIRGKGKFIYDVDDHKTRSDRIVVKLRKYK